MHLATSSVRVAETNDEGNYLIPALPIGRWALEVQSKGFQSQRVEGLNVELGRTIVQDFKLTRIADVVTITSDSLLVWSQYRGRIIGAMAVIVLQALLIAGLLFERSMRWRANRQLAESEQQFSKAFKANPQPMSITTLNEGRYLDVNESFLRMSGGTREEVIGHTSKELNNFEVPEDRQRLLVEPLLKDGGVHNFELKFRRKDGSFRTLLSSAELIELNKQKCILVASSDITERKESEHRLAELTGRLLRTQDEQRRHIARELHDVTAQSIGLILLNLAQVQGVAATMDKKSKDRLAESVALGEQALKEIRTLSYVLHPPLLDQAGLVTALKWYVKGFSERSGVKIEFTEEGDDGHRMPPDVEYALFRVVQECLTNIRRHTNSETADIRVTRTAKEVLLIIQDRGKAHHLELPRNGDGIESIGVGIAGMRHRLKQLGGELSVETDASGTRVTATVPVGWLSYDSSSPS
jgi:PAS domain S-box-containing protein